MPAAIQLIPGDPTHELAATVALLRATPPRARAPRLAPVLAELGSAVKLVTAVPDDLIREPATPADHFTGLATPADVARALADLATWRAAGHDVRSVLDSDYPSPLLEVFDRPPLLFLRGAWRGETDWRSVAVVGSREASSAGLARARRLARELAEAGYVVVSGLARGIDTAAHTAALDAGGRTIAVLGTGIDHVYPPENRPLAERIVTGDQGALISRFLPDQPTARWTFPLRNATMSGLARATVVVEAGPASGARLQARLALRHGRAVFLLHSLVDRQDWARAFVDKGAYGTRAVAVETTDDILGRLAAPPSGTSLAV